MTAVMACAVCGRDAFGLHGVPADESGCDDYLWACSEQCKQSIITKKSFAPVYQQSLDQLKGMAKVMLQVRSTDEYQAITDAIEATGEFIESTGTTDLAKMTSEQFRKMITIAALSFCAGVSSRVMKSDEIPF